MERIGTQLTKKTCDYFAQRYAKAYFAYVPVPSVTP